MSEKMFNNPNIDIYDIDFDLINRWEHLLDEAGEGRFDGAEFYSLCADTHKFIEKHEKEELVPHSALALLALIIEYSQSDWYIENRMDFFYSTITAYHLSLLLTDGIDSDNAEELLNLDYELNERWDWAFEDLKDKGIFDYKFFCDLAVDTFQFLKDYNESKLLPRNTLYLSKLLRDYTLFAYGHCEGNEEAFVAKELAGAFDECLVSGLTYETDEFMHPIFTFESNGKYRFDALTFDMSEAVANVPYWVKSPK